MKIIKIKKEEYDKYAISCAYLHKKYYPQDHLSSRLSIPLISVFYKILVEKSKHILLAINNDGSVVGFLIFGKYPKNILSKIFIKSPVKFMFFLVSNFIHIFKNITSKIGIREFKFNSSIDMRIISIVVDYINFKGIGALMEKDLTEKIKDSNINNIGLTVRKSNKRAIIFYSKLNYDIEYESKKHLYMRKIIYPKSS